MNFSEEKKSCIQGHRLILYIEFLQLYECSMRILCCKCEWWWRCGGYGNADIFANYLRKSVCVRWCGVCCDGDATTNIANRLRIIHERLESSLEWRETCR